MAPVVVALGVTVTIWHFMWPLWPCADPRAGAALPAILDGDPTATAFEGRGFAFAPVVEVDPVDSASSAAGDIAGTLILADVEAVSVGIGEAAGSSLFADTFAGDVDG